MDDFLDALKSELQQALDDADAERGGDPILEQLEQLLAGRVTLPLVAEGWEECIVEANRRIDAEEPPGCRDAEQDSDSPDGGAGDYLLWYQAARYAKAQSPELRAHKRGQQQPVDRAGARHGCPAV